MATVPRCFFAAMPSPEMAEEWFMRLASAGVISKLGRRVFAKENWHQTLSGRYSDPDAELVARLRQAGDRILASAVTVRLDRAKWSRGEAGASNHCTLLPRGQVPGFDLLLRKVQQALNAVRLGKEEGHRPHVTLSYDAGDVHPTVPLMPIEWTFDQVLLLKGHGNPYRYEVLGRWRLLPPSSPRHQDDLFALG